MGSIGTGEAGRMLRKAIFVVLVLIGPQGVFGDTLWDRAVHRFAENANWLAENTFITVVQRNGRDELMTQEVSHVQLYESSQGEIVTHVVYATKDGDDVTEERQEGSEGMAERFLAGDGDNPFTDINRSPLAPEERDNVTFVRTNRVAWKSGMRSRAYDFVHQLGRRERTIGTVWLSESEGGPVEMQFTVDPRPAFVNFVNVQLRYALLENGDMYVTDGVVEAEGQFLFVVRRFQLELEFTDHFRTDALN